ncbi:MAG: MotA/TolQ/ExbB proton channel family protein, partial [Opitutales bacterium]
LALAFALTASGAPLKEVEATAMNDLRSALGRLAKQRTTQQQAKTPLVREANALEESARAKRKQFERRLRLQDNQESSLAELEDEVDEVEGDLEATLALLREYNHSWFDGLSSSESEMRKERIKTVLINEEVNSFPKGPWSEIGPQFNLASLSVQRLQESFGGLRFSGQAVTPMDDVEEKGDFLVLGPAVYFASAESTASGVVEATRRSEQGDGRVLDVATLNRSRSSRVLLTPETISATIRNAVTAKSNSLVSLPLDPTLGKAILLASNEPTVIEELSKGGVWIFPILGFALISTLIACFKMYEIVSIKYPKGQPSLDGNYAKPFSALLRVANENQGKSTEILEEVLYEQIIEAQARLEKLLPVVAVTAAAAPLLGLLGTVTGMIDVFQQLTHSANPENAELARGISEALVTTKFGLVTAIPALIVHALLSRRVQGIVAKMESFASGFVSLASSENTPSAIDDPSSSDESGN